MDPLLQMCSMSASHLNASDMAAYMINCIHQIQSTLAVYEFTDKHIEMLAGQVGSSNYILRCLDYIRWQDFIENTRGRSFSNILSVKTQ